MTTQLFKNGDSVRLKNDHEYSGVITKVRTNPRSFGWDTKTEQWVHINGNPNPFDCEDLELIPTLIEQIIVTKTIKKERDNEPKVDFIVISEYLRSLHRTDEDTLNYYEREVKALLTKLSQSSSFAHKAHKELQRLMR